MGFDWESIPDRSGTGLDDAYDAAVSAVMYPDRPQPQAPDPSQSRKRPTSQTV